MACISAVIAWLSSAKRSLSRPCVVIDLVTHREMQPVSRPESALEVKSSTHEAKQLSTRPPKSFFFPAPRVSQSTGHCKDEGSEVVGRKEGVRS